MTEYAASDKVPMTVVIGHRNPDTDSFAAATGYAELKRMRGVPNVVAGCAGPPGARTDYLYTRFAVPLPRLFDDVAPLVRDVMDTGPSVVHKGQPLLDAMEYLRGAEASRIPVTDDEGRYVGMVSLFDMADRMFQKARNTDFDGGGAGAVGKSVQTSVALAARTLNARVTACSGDEDALRTVNVYVGAMSLEKLDREVLAGEPGALAVVVGDRADMHARLAEAGIAMLVVTGHASVDLGVLRRARETGCAVLQTGYDSATTVRRLKFSSPVELMLDDRVTRVAPEDKLSDVLPVLRTKRKDAFPVIDDNGYLLGVLSPYALDRHNPIQLVLVDHNELDQAVRGAEEVPVIEILDHHRLGIAPTERPIVVTNDIVGSTSTLVTELYRRHGLTPDPAIAGILLGGIVTDTLMLHSPTATARDADAVEFLQKVSGTDGSKLLSDIFNVGSVIASRMPDDVVNLDRKIYSTEHVTFSVSQVEEAGFENFEGKKAELREALARTVEAGGLAFAALLVTDVVREDSLLLTAGEKRLTNMMPYKRLEADLFELPEILSRKKQLLPVLLKVFSF